MNSNRCTLLGSLTALSLILSGCAEYPSKPPDETTRSRDSMPTTRAHSSATQTPHAVTLGPQTRLLPGWSDKSRAQKDGLIDFADSRAALPELPPMDGASVIGKIILKRTLVAAPPTSSLSTSATPQSSSRASLSTTQVQEPNVDINKLLMLSTTQSATAATDQRKKLLESDWACADPELSGSVYHFAKNGSLVIDSADRQHHGNYALLEQYRVFLVKDTTDKGSLYEQVAGSDERTLYLKKLQGSAVMRCAALKNGRFLNDEGFIFGEYQEMSAIWRCGQFGVLKFDEMGRYAWNGAEGNFVLKKNNARINILLIEAATPAGPFKRMIELDVDQSGMARGTIQVRLSDTGTWNACTAHP
jgi:hypothetical protein